MLFRETIDVYCENHTEHINTLCGQNAEFLNVRAGPVAVMKRTKSLASHETGLTASKVVSMFPLLLLKGEKPRDHHFSILCPISRDVHPTDRSLVSQFLASTHSLPNRHSRERCVAKFSMCSVEW
jgi:hypothetical protein